ncbi:hypothetical protein BDV93DRAFT_251495 [Ceratobasidium sp. AG-I]|nr:hypothetical protein BDV93DRAFT_251495 [Ceratobasidium sp. AG-I]
MKMGGLAAMLLELRLVSNGAIMAELSKMCASIACLEERGAAANPLTPRSSESSTPSSNSDDAHAQAPVPNAPVVVLVPEKKALITISMIREYQKTQRTASRKTTTCSSTTSVIIRNIMIRAVVDMAYSWKQQEQAKLGELRSFVRLVSYEGSYTISFQDSRDCSCARVRYIWCKRRSIANSPNVRSSKGPED